ncbi:MAG: adenine-specific DNA-methyltransferase [Myxococcota bacterium]
MYLGGSVLPDADDYGLRWPGWQGALAAADVPATRHLHPLHAPPQARDRLIIGDNLPAMKLLTDELQGAARLIYIDPPYNTGRRHPYPDHFRMTLRQWRAATGLQDDPAGLRHHTPWLSMLAPRLILARRLLHPDGVLFVSIDDFGVAHLRLLLDRIFGGSSFVASVVWQKVYAPKSTAKHFSQDHEHILVYAKNAAQWRPRLLPRTAAQDSRYRNLDGDLRGAWRGNNLAARNSYSRGLYSITCPGGRVIPGPPPGSYWRMSSERLAELDADGRIWWGESGNNVPAPKIYLSEVKPGRVPQTLWTYDAVGHTQEARNELQARVETLAGFRTPKPTRLIRRILDIATEPDRGDLVLDFFAGSGTTGEAVWQQNAADEGNRRFVLIQDAAPTRDPILPTVADLARARLDAAAEAIEGAGGVAVIEVKP